MIVSNCAFNSATALRRVFIPSNLDTSTCLHLTRIFVPALLPPAQQPQPQQQQQQARTYSRWGTPQSKAKAGTWAADLDAMVKRTRPSGQATSFPQPPTPPPRNMDRPGPRVKTKLARLPRDDEIREKFVYITRIQPDGLEQVTGRHLVQDVLATLDRKVESLEVIEMPKPEDPESRPWPTARIVNKKEELARKQKEKEQQKKKAATNKEKELELNWALAPHDVEHKLRTLKKFLAKGYKVQLLLLKKSGRGAKATKQEAEALLEKIVEVIAEVPGSKEWKNREGQLLGSMKVFVQGKLQETEQEKAAIKG